MTTARSRTGKQLVTAALAAGWTVHVTPGHGTTERSTFGPARGDGTRPRTTEHVPCRSEGVRLRSPDRAQNAVVVLVSLDDKSWATDQAWGWDTGQLPRRIDVRALLAYLKTLPVPAQLELTREDIAA